MSTADDIVAVPSGARFHRADLHIHSCGGSHDVKDVGMTPDAIVKTALSENLALIAITDHNEITNVRDSQENSNCHALQDEWCLPSELLRDFPKGNRVSLTCHGRPRL
jgi:histidinol phosphatase-like PHP family hydrolase